jgi:hypothetical protein
MSSDSNSLYLDFWPIVSKIWKKKFNITPILYYIDENHNIEISEEFGKVIKLKPIDNIPVYLQCLWVRYWAFSEYPDDINILSDIDMLPLSKEYFIDSIESVDSNMYVHLNPCIDTYGMLPSCYHVCSGKLFKEIVNIHDKWEDSIKFIHSLQIGSDPGGMLSGKHKWFTDERYSSEQVLNYQKNNPSKIKLIDRIDGQNGRRIDRSHWFYDNNKLKDEWYFDSHSIRPYGENQVEINKIVNIVLE